MKKLERKWKRIIGWTLFIHLILLVAFLRFQWTRQIQDRTWRDTLGDSPAQRLPHSSPSRPDKSVEEVSRQELTDLLSNASSEWEKASPEKRERALMSRVEEIGSMEPERVEGVVTHLLTLSGAEKRPEKRVELNRLDLSSAVPVNMRESVNGEGVSGVIMELQDAEGQVGEIWVPASELSPEEEQALRAFKVMNRVPALHELRPLLTPLLRK